MKNKIFSVVIALALAFSLSGAALPAVVQANDAAGSAFHKPSALRKLNSDLSALM